MEIRADNGYFAGIGVFETIDVVEGHCVFLASHLERLNASAKYFQLDKAVSQQEVAEYLEPYGAYSGALKITLSPENTIFSRRENPYQTRQDTPGFTLTFSEVRRNETSPFTYHKTLNRGENAWEKAQAQERGFDEVIFLNTGGEIAEGAVTNIFFVKEGGIFTPRVSCGLLNGILRQYVIKNYTVTETAIHYQALEKFTECFITNSLMGIMPVQSLGHKNFSQQTTALKLQADYEREKARL